jgi:hypothetical protein
LLIVLLVLTGCEIEVIEYFDNLDFPWQQAKSGQPVKGVQIGPGDWGGAITIAAIAVPDAAKGHPEVAQGFGEWRQGQFFLKLGNALWRPGSFQLALQMVSVGMALFIEGRQREFALRKIDQILSERGIKDFSLATNSMA